MGVWKKKLSANPIICYNFADLRNEYYYGLPWDLLSEFGIYRYL